MILQTAPLITFSHSHMPFHIRVVEQSPRYRMVWSDTPGDPWEVTGEDGNFSGRIVSETSDGTIIFRCLRLGHVLERLGNVSDKLLRNIKQHQISMIYPIQISGIVPFRHSASVSKFWCIYFNKQLNTERNEC